MQKREKKKISNPMPTPTQTAIERVIEEFHSEAAYPLVPVVHLEHWLRTKLIALVAQTRADTKKEIAEWTKRYRANAETHTKNDCIQLYEGCTEDAKAEALSDLLTHLSQ